LPDKSLAKISEPANLKADMTMDSITRVNSLDSYPAHSLTFGALPSALKGDNQRPVVSATPIPYIPITTDGHGPNFADDHNGLGFSVLA
jgi:hypothetical protein